MLTIRETATALRRCTRTVREFIRDGRLRATRLSPESCPSARAPVNQRFSDARKCLCCRVLHWSRPGSNRLPSGCKPDKILCAMRFQATTCDHSSIGRFVELLGKCRTEGGTKRPSTGKALIRGGNRYRLHDIRPAVLPDARFAPRSPNAFLDRCDAFRSGRSAWPLAGGSDTP